jgi:hypothetical protein
MNMYMLLFNSHDNIQFYSYFPKHGKIVMLSTMHERRTVSAETKKIQKLLSSTTLPREVLTPYSNVPQFYLQ